MVGAALAWAQVPPNDYYTNRITLTGPVVVFTADTSVASWPDEYENSLEPIPILYEPTVWWSWTAQDATPVIIERYGESTFEEAGLVVYANTNFYEMNSAQVSEIDLFNRGQYTIFLPTAGKEYLIQFGGKTAKPVFFRLTTTNSPIFRLHPKSQTLFPGQSALFTSSATGIAPMSFQWLKDGVNILGATNRCLAFHHVNSGDAAGYSMVATSATGTSTSRVAQLVVRTNSINPLLQAKGIWATRTFQFTISGEAGRVYRCEQSIDLTNWFGSVFFATNTSSVFSVAQDAPQKFVRLSDYYPADEICNCNLKQVWYALWQCSEDHHASRWSTYFMLDLAPYCVNGVYPKCPLDVPEYFEPSYTVTDASTKPRCIWSPYTHILEETWVAPQPIDF